jgi:hypothetical protein
MFIAVVMICFVMPLIIPVFVISVFLFAKIISYYLLTAREIKRLDGNFKAPVISSFKELISG